MFDVDKWQEIFIALKKNKLRTFLTASGVVFGIFILITLLGIGKGFKNKMTANFGEFATNSAYFWTNTTTMPYLGLPKYRSYTFRNADLKTFKKRIPELEYIAPEINGWSSGAGANVHRLDKKGDFNIKGVSEENFLVDPIKIKEGRIVNQNDVRNKKKVVFIGERVREVLFEKDESPIGKYIKIKNVYFLVVGVIKPLNQNMGENKEESVYMPYTTLQQVYNRGDKFYAFLATAKKGYSIKTVQEKLFKEVSRIHKIHPEDKKAIGTFNLEDIFNQFNGFFHSITFLMWIIGVGTLISGIIGVSNIMLVVVKERTKEIGIKRAIGAVPRKIISQILTESVFLTTFSGFWGLVFGVGIVELVASNSPTSPEQDGMLLNPQVDFNVAIMAIVILVIFGAIAGYIPALRAIKIKPIDALRDE